MTRKPPARINPNDRSCFRETGRGLVEYKFFPPIVIALQRLLIRLVDELVAKDEKVHLRPHEAAIGVFRTANDRLATDVERGVHDDGGSGTLLERLQQPVISGIRFFVNGLNPSRVV